MTISERLRAAYTAWNNPPSEGLPSDAGCVLEAADAIDALVAALERIERHDRNNPGLGYSSLGLLIDSAVSEARAALARVKGEKE